MVQVVLVDHRFSSVLVAWDYHGEEYNLNFRVDITGVSQDDHTSDGTLAHKVMSWFVTHDLTPHPGNGAKNAHII